MALTDCIYFDGEVCRSNQYFLRFSDVYKGAVELLTANSGELTSVMVEQLWAQRTDVLDYLACPFDSIYEACRIWEDSVNSFWEREKDSLDLEGIPFSRCGLIDVFSSIISSPPLLSRKSPTIYSQHVLKESHAIQGYGSNHKRGTSPCRDSVVYYRYNHKPLTEDELSDEILMGFGFYEYESPLSIDLLHLSDLFALWEKSLLQLSIEDSMRAEEYWESVWDSMMGYIDAHAIPKLHDKLAYLQNSLAELNLRGILQSQKERVDQIFYELNCMGYQPEWIYANMENMCAALLNLTEEAMEFNAQIITCLGSFSSFHPLEKIELECFSG